MSRNQSKSDEARKAVDLLFNHIGIRRVVSVDDRQADSKYGVEEFIGACISAGRSFVVDIPSLQSMPYSEDVNTWRDLIRQFWDNMDEGEKSKAFDDLQKIVDTPHAEDTHAASALNSIFGNIELLEYSLREWHDNRDRLLSEARGGVKTLFLFDKDLSREPEAGGTEEGGIELLRDIQESTTDSEALCGILSHTTSIEQEYDAWRGYEGRVEMDRFIFVSKQRLEAKNWSGFAGTLKLLAINGACKDLVMRISDIIRDAHADALRKIKEFTVYDIEEIVFRSSNVEGVWEPDTLFRVFNLFHRAYAMDRAKADSNLRALTDKIRSVSTISTSTPAASQTKARNIQRLELYEDGANINRYYSPIELGDIFESTKGPFQGNKYILIAQPCDLMVRMESGQRAPGVQEAVLAELTTAKPPSSQLEAFFELPFYSGEDSSLFVSFRKIHTVILFALDMCVFRNDGQAIFEIGKTCPTGVIPAWKNHYRHMQEWAKGIMESSRKLCDELGISDDSEHFRSLAVLAMPPSSNTQLFQRSFSSSILNYNCKRVGRLTELRSSALLARFARYMARPAFLGPLA